MISKSEHTRFVESTESTSKYLRELMEKSNVEPPMMVYTGYQTHGRGQRGKVWESEADKNILCSMLAPKPTHEHFLASVTFAASLSIADLVFAMGAKNIRIKWPNDVYVNHKKIAGILIENVFRGQELRSTIVGIGVNVNQKSFRCEGATSIQNIRGSEFDIYGATHALMNYFYGYMKYEHEALLESANSCLYKKHEPVTFFTENGIETYIVNKLEANGNLSVISGDSEISLEHHKVKWIG